MPTEIETKALEAACEKATDKLEIDWDGDEPFVRSDSIETAVEAAIRAYLAALDSPIGEQGVKPLDLANLLHHAFAAGGRAQPWTDYDPATCHAYARILSALSPERKETVAWTVYDWEYREPDGRWNYARTPERAERLLREGVKLTPVYVPELPATPGQPT